jgi:hypothetical protein
MAHEHLSHITKSTETTAAQTLLDQLPNLHILPEIQHGAAIDACFKKMVRTFCLRLRASTQERMKSRTRV